MREGSSLFVRQSIGRPQAIEYEPYQFVELLADSACLSLLQQGDKAFETDAAAVTKAIVEKPRALCHHGFAMHFSCQTYEFALEVEEHLGLFFVFHTLGEV